VLLEKKLAGYDALNLTNTEVSEKYPRNAELIKLAVNKGFIKKDSIGKADKNEYKDILTDFMKKNGYKPRPELFRQFINQKILRASYTNNQLQEILTDFWFNHFNVSITKPQCAEFIPAYERDVIRPNVFGKFNTLLVQTAKSPAMLFYLDNFSSSGNNSEVSEAMNVPQLNKRLNPSKKALNATQVKALEKLKNAKKNQGLNENYAREVMELHTLGVDGGYTQQDVTQAARILTGWTVYPFGDYGTGALKKTLDRIGEDKLTSRGFVRDKDFLFVPGRHDMEEKTVLGKKFAAGGGYNEGVELLNMLAHHKSTARFISRKLAIRFVSDDPSEVLVAAMAKTFLDKDGDIRSVLTTMIYSPEFWGKTALRNKTKSPFELAISTVRGLNAEITQPYQLYTWITKMGQKMYYYQAPTGFPDNGQYWINTGSLLNRMNFGLSIAAQRIPGIKVDLGALNNNHEPESADAALATYSKLIMPERSVDETVKRLSSMVSEKGLAQRVDEAAAQKQAASMGNSMNSEDDLIMTQDTRKKQNKGQGVQGQGNYTMLAQVVGVIIGSPEFQRK
ncbi:MAG: DUF1800 domain-containing protein, partial [Pedobacter sp.]